MTHIRSIIQEIQDRLDLLKSLLPADETLGAEALDRKMGELLENSSVLAVFETRAKAKDMFRMLRFLRQGPQVFGKSYNYKSDVFAEEEWAYWATQPAAAFEQATGEWLRSLDRTKRVLGRRRAVFPDMERSLVHAGLVTVVSYGLAQRSEEWLETNLPAVKKAFVTLLKDPRFNEIAGSWYHTYVPESFGIWSQMLDAIDAPAAEANPLVEYLEQTIPDPWKKGQSCRVFERLKCPRCEKGFGKEHLANAVRLLDESIAHAPEVCAAFTAEAKQIQAAPSIDLWNQFRVQDASL